jgi:hypothetical protein
MRPRVPHPTNINWVQRPSMPRMPRPRKGRAPRQITPRWEFQPIPMVIGTRHGWAVWALEIAGTVATAVALRILIMPLLPALIMAAVLVAVEAWYLIHAYDWRPFGVPEGHPLYPTE